MEMGKELRMNKLRTEFKHLSIQVKLERASNPSSQCMARGLNWKGQFYIEDFRSL